ncbi:fimbrial protein [Pseudocitrobacter corydidari]
MSKILISLILTISTAWADNLNFHGTLITPPVCTINNDKTIEVNFNQIIIDNIDGVNYLTDVPWELSCDSSVRSDLLAFSLTYLGTASNYTPDAISTNIQGLGIVLQEDGQVFRPGSTITITESSLPVLKAVPIKKENTTLTEGEFEAFATLQVEYQ